MIKLIHKTFFTIPLLVFLLIAAISVFALGEDFTITADELNSTLNKPMALLLLYIAIKFHAGFLIKAALINSFGTLISWKAIAKPAIVKELFSFQRKDVYFVYSKSLTYEIKKLIPICNKNIGLENKIRFCMNPISIAISIISCFTELWLYEVDHAANAISKRLHKSKSSTDSEWNTSSSNAYVSVGFCRFLKGTVVIISELSVSFLKIIKPIADIPYWVIYFISIVMPDYIAYLLFSNKHEKPENNVLQAGLHTGYNQQTQNIHGYSSASAQNKNSKYIQDQLIDPPSSF